MARSVQQSARTVKRNDHSSDEIRTPLSNAAPSATSHESDPRAEGRRVLLAEDDHDLREALALVMRREGYEVVELEDGWQLLQYLNAQRLLDGDRSSVDVVISDIRMPRKSGLDVLAGLQWGQQRPPPFIFVTAFGDAETRAEALRLGAAALVIKPVRLDEMRTLVRQCLEPVL